MTDEDIMLEITRRLNEVSMMNCQNSPHLHGLKDGQRIALEGLYGWIMSQNEKKGGKNDGAHP